MGEEADADWQEGLIEAGIEDALIHQKPTCRCGRAATIITKPHMLLCDKCARKIFPRFKR